MSVYNFNSFSLIKVILSSDCDFSLDANKKRVRERIRKLPPEDRNALYEEFSFLLDCIKPGLGRDAPANFREKGLALLLLLDSSQEPKNGQPVAKIYKLWSKVPSPWKEADKTSKQVVAKLSEVRNRLIKPIEGCGFYVNLEPVDLREVITDIEGKIVEEQGLPQDDALVAKRGQLLELAKRAEEKLKLEKLEQQKGQLGVCQRNLASLQNMLIGLMQNNNQSLNVLRAALPQTIQSAIDQSLGDIYGFKRNLEALDLLLKGETSPSIVKDMLVSWRSEIAKGQIYFCAKFERLQSLIDYQKALLESMENGTSLPVIPELEVEARGQFAEGKIEPYYFEIDSAPVCLSKECSEDVGTLIMTVQRAWKSMMDEDELNKIFGYVSGYYCLKNKIYENFYALLKENGLVKSENENLGRIIFHREGNWRSFVNDTFSIELNLLRLQAIYRTVMSEESRPGVEDKQGVASVWKHLRDVNGILYVSNYC
jgi:hypothetical protein